MIRSQNTFEGTNLRPNEKKWIWILSGLAALSVIGMIVALCIPRTPKTGAFTPPAFEPAAERGSPDVGDRQDYTELYRDGMAYRVSLCGAPTAEGQTLTVWFTSAADNQSYLKLRVLDKSGKTLGETGLLRPGEYVRCVSLDRALAAAEPLTLKVMGYDPETFESTGAVTLNVTAAGK